MAKPLNPRLFRALDLWQRRIRAGKDGQRADSPATWKCDALYRAACWEQSALGAMANENIERARDSLLRARKAFEETGL